MREVCRCVFPSFLILTHNACLTCNGPLLPNPRVCHNQAAILQQTSDYIFALEQEKTQLLQQNNQLKRFIQVRPTLDFQKCPRQCVDFVGLI